VWNGNVQILLNGESRALSEPATVASLLDQLDVPRRYVAVEVNGDLIPRAQHASHALHPGDQVEIVTLTGGG
jgi:sulfur carrier protein